MGFSESRQWLSTRPYIITLAIVIILILWMISGVTQTQENPSKIKQKAEIAKVQVKTMLAENINSTLELYGRTEPDRISTVKAEVQGKVIEVLAEQGSRIKKGDAIVRVELNDLTQQLESSQALLQQREIEYDGAKALNKNGNIGKSQLAQALADIKAVKAQIKRLKITIGNTVIKAPFDGVLNNRNVEVGDHLSIGDPIAVIADLKTIIVSAYATENQVHKLSVGQKANIRLLKHPQTNGVVRYIASIADKETNTFKIEIEVENGNYFYKAGISGEASIPLAKQWAIHLSPALLALDEEGNIGVKSVADNTVIFTPIEIMQSDADGIWLTGLGKQADIITLGQGFVRAGDTVNPIMEAK